MDKGRMMIGEVAEHLGTSARALRHYEQQGLLSPGRGPNGYREYDDTDVVRAGNIRELLDLGLTTADVHQYLVEGCLDRPLSAGPGCAAELVTVRQRLHTLDELIHRLQATRDRLAEHATTLAQDAHIP